MRVQLPLLPLALSVVLGGAIAAFSYSAGWMVHYTIKLGVSGALQEYVGRLQDAFGLAVLELPGRPPRPRPSGAAGPTPSPSPSPEEPFPSATPTPARHIPERKRTVREEMHAAVAQEQRLSPSARQELLAIVDRSPAEGLDAALALLGALAARRDVPPDAAQDVTHRVMTAPPVLVLLALGQIEGERIAFNWDARDVVAAYAQGKEKGIAALATGRPEQFFLDLDTEESAFAACMAALRRREPPASPSASGMPVQSGVQAGGEGASGGDSASGTGTSGMAGDTGIASGTQASGTTGVGAPATCPAGGVYAPGADGHLACSIHGSPGAPYARVAVLRHFLGSLGAARRLSAQLQYDEAARRLYDLLRMCPEHTPCVGELARILIAMKDWPQAATFLKTWAPRSKANVAMCLWAATALHASGDLAGAVQWAQQARLARPESPPPVVGDRAQFFLLRDRAAVVQEMAQKGVRFEDFTMSPDEELPSVKCRQRLGLVRDAIKVYAQGYPKTNPLVARLQERELPLHTKLKVTADKAARDAIVAQIRAYRAKERELLADTTGKAFLRGLASVLAQTSFAGCPQGGRYALTRGRWLDCSEHPGIFPDPAIADATHVPSAAEEGMLSRALQNGVLTGEPERKACFVVQKELVSLTQPAGPSPIASGVPEVQAGGKTFRCPSGGLLSTTEGQGGARVLSCSLHGSFQTYFAAESPEERGQ